MIADGHLVGLIFSALVAAIALATALYAASKKNLPSNLAQDDHERIADLEATVQTLLRENQSCQHRIQANANEISVLRTANERLQRENDSYTGYIEMLRKELERRQT